MFLSNFFFCFQFTNLSKNSQFFITVNLKKFLVYFDFVADLLKSGPNTIRIGIFKLEKSPTRIDKKNPSLVGMIFRANSNFAQSSHPK